MCNGPTAGWMNWPKPQERAAKNSSTACGSPKAKEKMETKCFVHEGGVIYSRPLVNFTERRHYLELAAKYGGYYVDKQQIELADQGDDLPEEQVIKKAEALLAALKGEA